MSNICHIVSVFSVHLWQVFEMMIFDGNAEKNVVSYVAVIIPSNVLLV